MNFSPLPDDWSEQRDTLHFLAAHLLAQARERRDGMFDLVPSPGGFATPPVGHDRERVRLVGGSLLVERVVGETIRDAAATTTNASRPVWPWSTIRVPAVILISSAARATFSSSLLLHALNSATLRRVSRCCLLLAMRAL